jgi:hypothetical protein
MRNFGVAATRVGQAKGKAQTEIDQIRATIKALALRYLDAVNAYRVEGYKYPPDYAAREQLLTQMANLRKGIDSREAQIKALQKTIASVKSGAYATADKERVAQAFLARRRALQAASGTVFLSETKGTGRRGTDGTIVWGGSGHLASTDDDLDLTVVDEEDLLLAPEPLTPMNFVTQYKWPLVGAGVALTAAGAWWALRGGTKS